MKSVSSSCTLRTPIGFFPVAVAHPDRGMTFPGALKMTGTGIDGGLGCCQGESHDGVQESENQAVQRMEAERIWKR